MVCAVARRVFSSSSQSHGPWVSAVASAPPLYVFLPPESAPEFGIAHDPINQEGARAVSDWGEYVAQAEGKRSVHLILTITSNVYVFTVPTCSGDPGGPRALKYLSLPG